jgi:hypothetical protein
MKKVIFLGLIITLIIGSCTQEKKSPIEGTWKLVSAKTANGAIFPIDYQGSQIKMFTKGYFAYFGHFGTGDSLTVVNHSGGGPYKFEGNRCEVIREYYYTESLVGTTGRWLIEIRNDTLIQKQPADENWNLGEKFGTEIYVRVD